MRRLADVLDNVLDFVPSEFDTFWFELEGIRSSSATEPFWWQEAATSLANNIPNPPECDW